VRRVVFRVVGLYLVVAIVTRTLEAAGIGSRRCGCEPECWCKRPEFTLFRWVTPTGTHHLLSAADKQMLDQAQISY